MLNSVLVEFIDFLSVEINKYSLFSSVHLRKMQIYGKAIWIYHGELNFCLLNGNGTFVVCKYCCLKGQWSDI